ncbi:MAG: hypothetical protein FWC34_00405 [Bacteroidetes bacterium]|nr:hypothetical protein [Bacteroidota bacterium]
MPKEIELAGNRSFTSENNIIYFGVRNELGYFFDDIFLFALENSYSLNTEQQRRFARVNGLRFLFHSKLRSLNRDRIDPNRPQYLKLTDEEISFGYSPAGRHPNGGWPFNRFTLKITIPTWEALLKEFYHVNYVETNIKVATDQSRANRVALIGNCNTRRDLPPFSSLGEKGFRTFAGHIFIRDPSQRALRDAAHAFRDGRNYTVLRTLRNRHFSDIIDSGKGAIRELRNHAVGKPPITEIFFSTHGTVYAVDFHNSLNNLYTTRNEMNYLFDEDPWVYGEDAAFIEDLVCLVNNGKIAPNVTMLFTSCLLAARIEEAQRKQECDCPVRNVSDLEKKLLARWIEKNKGLGKPRNFSLQLSEKIPGATIIAPMDQNNTRYGIQHPVLYQNGLRWFIPITAINATMRSTIYPMDIL